MGHLRAVKTTCKQYSCPDCFEKAAYRESLDGEERIFRAGKLLNILHKVRHVVFSPPSSLCVDSTEEGYKRLRAWLWRRLKKYALPGYGGIMVFHSARLTEAAVRRYFLTRVDGERKWDWWRAQIDRDSLVYWSPHFHFVGYIYLEKSDKVFAETGLVYKVVQFDLSGLQVQGVLRYLLSHKAVAKVGRVQTHSWIGVCSKVRLGFIVVKKTYEPLFCGVCGKPLYCISVDDMEFEAGVPCAVNFSGDCKAFVDGRRALARIIEHKHWFIRKPRAAPERVVSCPIVQNSLAFEEIML